jgi:hypothetical protein
MAVLALSVTDFNLSNSARNIAWKAIKLRRNKALPVSKSGSTSLEANETKPVGFFLLVVWLILDHPKHFALRARARSNREAKSSS